MIQKVLILTRMKVKNFGIKAAGLADKSKACQIMMRYARLLLILRTTRYFLS